MMESIFILLLYLLFRKYPKIEAHPNEECLIKYIKGRLAAAIKKIGHSPKVMVMGALGRCGTGAKDFALKVDIPDADIIKWDMQETVKGGPFEEILKNDIFVNCIYLSTPIPPFLTKDMLEKERKLSVICDVSCDGKRYETFS